MTTDVPRATCPSSASPSLGAAELGAGHLARLLDTFSGAVPQFDFTTGTRIKGSVSAGDTAWAALSLAAVGVGRTQLDAALTVLGAQPMKAAVRKGSATAAARATDQPGLLGSPRWRREAAGGSTASVNGLRRAHRRHDAGRPCGRHADRRAPSPSNGTAGRAASPAGGTDPLAQSGPTPVTPVLGAARCPPRAARRRRASAPRVGEARTHDPATPLHDRRAPRRGGRGRRARRAPARARRAPRHGRRRPRRRRTATGPTGGARAPGSRTTGGRFASVGRRRRHVVQDPGSSAGGSRRRARPPGRRPPRRARPSPTLCPTLAPVAGSVRVALVIDYGTTADAPPGAEAADARVGARSSASRIAGAPGTDVLRGATPPVRVRSENGLICALDGYPRNECAPVVPDPAPTPTADEDADRRADAVAGRAARAVDPGTRPERRRRRAPAGLPTTGRQLGVAHRHAAAPPSASPPTDEQRHASRPTRPSPSCPPSRVHPRSSEQSSGSPVGLVVGARRRRRDRRLRLGHLAAPRRCDEPAHRARARRPGPPPLDPPGRLVGVGARPRHRGEPYDEPARPRAHRRRRRLGRLATPTGRPLVAVLRRLPAPRARRHRDPRRVHRAARRRHRRARARDAARGPAAGLDGGRQHRRSGHRRGAAALGLPRDGPRDDARLHRRGELPREPGTPARQRARRPLRGRGRRRRGDDVRAAARRRRRAGAHRAAAARAPGPRRRARSSAR